MTPTSCPDCDQAEINPHWAGTTGWCWDCRMRSYSEALYPLTQDKGTGARRALAQHLHEAYPHTHDECSERIEYWHERKVTARLQRE